MRPPLDLGPFNADIRGMTQTRYISGQPGFLKSLMRGLILAAMAIGGIFVLMTGAVVAFFVVAGLTVFGLAVFALFWAKAKITGKPFGPQAHYEQARQDMEAQFKAYREPETDGPVIDARQTPDGWSVED